MEKEREMSLISEVLNSFRIGHGEISVTKGPSVALYEFEPAIGVRMSKIRNLKDEFGAVLQTGGVRVIAPIPGKGTVGIEVPNREREIVAMDEMLSSREFTESKMSLPLAIGKTVEGNDFVVDLADMPHLLIAGATGQGKSVGLNVIIASLLRKHTPQELSLVLVDPKQVELSVYEDIARPYLMHFEGHDPICTEADLAQQTLDGIINIMEDRYRWLKACGVRNIQEYNQKKYPDEKMPYIVVIIDEYGDLVMTADSEMEHSICRLAQKARAVGIHLIISTQRPDVSIVTGNIKANFPTRIAFRTTTGTDSRVILDRNGAERLTGKGDMLYFSGGDFVRVQCAYISTGEVIDMCREIKEKYTDCKEKLLHGAVVQEMPIDPEEQRRRMYPATKWTLPVMLHIAQYDYLSQDVIDELKMKFVAPSIYNEYVKAQQYGIVGEWERDGAVPVAPVLIKDPERIKVIVEYYTM